MNNKTVLFGGSFDPPHLGHLMVAQWVSEFLSAAVRFLPCGNPPHKDAVSHHRLDMVGLAIADNQNFLLDDYEYTSGRVNYTVDTVNYYSNKYDLGRSQLFFVLGSDSLNTIEHWRNYSALIDLCTLVVYRREPLDSEVFDRLKDGGAEIKICPAPVVQISSSMVRERVAQGKSIDYLVTQPVKKYIEQVGLYRKEIRS